MGGWLKWAALVVLSAGAAVGIQRELSKLPPPVLEPSMNTSHGGLLPSSSVPSPFATA